MKTADRKTKSRKKSKTFFTKTFTFEGKKVMLRLQSNLNKPELQSTLVLTQLHNTPRSIWQTQGAGRGTGLSPGQRKRKWEEHSKNKAPIRVPIYNRKGDHNND